MTGFDLKWEGEWAEKMAEIDPHGDLGRMKAALFMAQDRDNKQWLAGMRDAAWRFNFEAMIARNRKDRERERE